MMTREQLIEMQEFHLGWAREQVRQDGHVYPIAFIVAESRHAMKGIKYAEIPAQVLKGGNDMAEMGIVVVMMQESWENLYRSATIAWTDLSPPGTPPLLSMLLEASPGEGEDKYKHVVRPFLRATGIEERDIATAAVRFVARQVQAQAVIVCHEGWLREMQPGETRKPGSLSQDPQAVEHLICNMDARDYVRAVYTPVLREEPSKGADRDSGKVVGFGEPRVVIDDGVERPGKNPMHMRLEGRMVRFLARKDVPEPVGWLKLPLRRPERRP